MGIFGRSTEFGWDGLLDYLVGDGGENSDFLDSAIGNILSVSTENKPEAV